MDINPPRFWDNGVGAGPFNPVAIIGIKMAKTSELIKTCHKGRLVGPQPSAGKSRCGSLVVVGLLMLTAVVATVWASAPARSAQPKKADPAANASGRSQGALESRRPDPRPEERVWGQPVEGLSLRLRAEKKLWHRNVAPRLRVDLRYLGDRRLLTSANATLYQLEVDGVWYGANDNGAKLVDAVTPNADPFTVSEIPADFEIEADRPVNDLPVMMDSSWRTAHTNELSGAQHGGSGIWLPSDLQRQPLKLAPGKHTVRLAIFALPTRAGGPTVVRALSNPVEIEISDEFDHGPDVSLGEPALDRALDRVYAQLQPLFQKYYPKAIATNLHRNGIHFEHDVTTYEFPYTGPPGMKHERTTQRGPKKGGILCSVYLQKGPYRGPLAAATPGDKGLAPKVDDKKVYKRLLMAPYAARQDIARTPGRRSIQSGLAIRRNSFRNITHQG